eukprot:CAMPEP_0171255200 /NCGR_PEP_ID=MMETSP0790-20130122/52640_1 /TAXON_ID=2925 /ORGANISM="Alexandrium catenella, Strain OF101" /LENGTH=208 /DNA_ID=CAMNT_0011723137 /DNA_START=1 /DNA_END=624 /DNA_ORIENTATION=+
MHLHPPKMDATGLDDLKFPCECRSAVDQFDLRCWSTGHRAATGQPVALRHVGERRTRASEIHDPVWDGAHSKPPAELVAEVAAVPPQGVVVLDGPGLLKRPHESDHFALAGRGAAHHDGLTVLMPLATPRLAAEDAVALAGRGIAVAPLHVVNLDSAVERAGAQGSQEPVDGGHVARASHIVDVEDHRLVAPRAHESLPDVRSRVPRA